ncbi:flippase [Providencia rettgeri]|uniref:flippase n=1 Tax=Providencia rettgeri TaxID=587 RepID=UPI00244A1EE2|nr:flippase [Providencia rettgeri]MDH2378024.1 flippase [Providencia rettgeri]MDV5234152.1 flippase [Providencia rettgeri]
MLTKINFITKINAKIKSNPNIQKIVSNSSWLLLDKFVRMGLGLAVSAWVARYLGPTQYGELAYVLAYLAFFQAVCTLGMDGLIVRDIAKNKNNAGEILGTVFTLRIIIGLICWFCAVGGMVLLNGWNSQSVYITALAGATLVFQAADTIDLWFQSQSQNRRTVIVKLTAYIISNGIKIVLILSNASILAFSAVITFETSAIACGLFYAYRKFPCSNLWNRTKQRAITLLHESWPFMISGLSIVLYMRVDQLMIKNYLGDAELGIYAAVLPLATLWQFLPMTLSVSLAPMLAQSKAQGDDHFYKTLGYIFRVFAILGWLICIPISMLSYFIVNILFGEIYIAGASVLSIIVFTNLFINMGVAQSLWIVNERKSKLSLYKTLMGAVVCVTANIILIPYYGIVGAAISAVLAQAVSAILSNLVLSRKIFSMQLRSLLLLK